MQQDQFAAPGDDVSPDSQERIRDFLARHGGPCSLPSRGEQTEFGTSGWSEVFAADGYRLRCDWSRLGSREELKFSEIAPSPNDPTRTPDDSRTSEGTPRR